MDWLSNTPNCPFQGITRKTRVLGAATTRKRGVFGTGFEKREGLIGTEVSQKRGLGSLFIYYLYFYLSKWSIGGGILPDWKGEGGS